MSVNTLPPEPPLPGPSLPGPRSPFEQASAVEPERADQEMSDGVPAPRTSGEGRVSEAEDSLARQGETQAAEYLASKQSVELSTNGESGIIGDQAEAYAAAHHSVNTGDFTPFGPSGVGFKLMATPHAAEGPAEEPERTAARRERLLLEMSKVAITLPEPPHRPGIDS